MDASSRSKEGNVPLIVQALDDIIAAVRAIGLQETGDLLRVARLDLLMRVHGIEAEELELLTLALARNGGVPQKRSKRAAVERRRAAQAGKRSQLKR